MTALFPPSPPAPCLNAFVGRVAELGILEAALRDARCGSGRLVLVAGEPGIGKTRLCEEFAARARQTGATVLYGRCDESGGAPAFSPWVRALGGAVRSMEAAELRAALADDARDVAQLVLPIRERLPEVAPPPDLDPTEERVRLFDGVSRFLGRLARPHGLVVVLDDLHGADPSSLLLLELVARELVRIPVVVLGTYRDTAVTPEHPMMAMLAATTGLAGMRRLSLRGLSADEMVLLVEQRAGVGPPASLVMGLHDKTDGNPLFVGEYLRALAAEGRLTPDGFAEGLSSRPPARVQTVIAWRLATLSDGARSMLRTAAVIGREFRFAELQHAVGTAGESAEGGELLAEALAAGIVAPDPEAPGSYRFAHALIRDTLYEELSADERVRTHRQVGEAIERSGSAAERLAELAYHFCATDLDKGVGYAQRAGERAMSLLAWEEAVHLYRLGLSALAKSASPSPRTECKLLLALGDAQARADDLAGAKSTLLRAAAIARRCGLRELLSTAALGYGTEFAEGDRPATDPTQTALLGEALQLWHGRDGTLHVRLLARLALALIFSPSPQRSAALGTQAVEMAERVADPDALAYALRARRMVARPPADATGRLADADRIVALAHASGNRRLELQAHCWRLHDQLELADAAAATHEVEHCARLAAQLRQPAYRFEAALLRVGQPLREGRWSEAQRLLDDACAITPDQARSHYAAALCRANASLFRGGMEEIADFFVAMLELYPTAAVRAGCAYYLARLGRAPAARRHIDRLAADNFASVPLNIQVVALCHLASACVIVGDKERAATLYELLAPCDSLAAIMVVIEAYCGPVAHYLALLATALGRWEAAERHFEHALEISGRLRARPWLAETQHEFARMLRARDQKGDVERADRLLGEALATAADIDMPALRLRMESPQERGATPIDGSGDRAVAEQAHLAIPAQRGEPGGAVAFLERGDHWAVSYAGVELQLKDSKGLRYLAYLVRHPRRELEAADLAAEVADGADEQDALPAAADRRERARSAVTKRIRAEIKRIAAAHPALGRHLAATISTGHVCHYAPEGKRARRRPPAAGEDA